MKISDQQIKSILNETRLEYKNDTNIENDIMNSIENLSGYDTILLKAKKRAKFGLKACTAISVFLVISIFYSLFKSGNEPAIEMEAFLPSIVVFIMMIVLFILVEGSKGLSDRKIQK